MTTTTGYTDRPNTITKSTEHRCTRCGAAILTSEAMKKHEQWHASGATPIPQPRWL